MSKNLEQAYENFTEEYNSKSNTVPWFVAQFKTHLSKNITLEDWNSLQKNLQNITSDGESVKKLLDNIFKYLSEDNTYTDEEINALIKETVVNLGRYTNNDFIEGIKHFVQDVEEVHMSRYPHVEGDSSTLHTVCYTAAIKYVTVYTFYSGDQFSFLKIFTNNPVHSEYVAQLQWNDSTNQYDVIVVDVTSYSKTEIDNKLTGSNLISTIGYASETHSGIMSFKDKQNLNTLVTFIREKGGTNDVVDTIAEVLAIFNQYPEGVDLAAILEDKANKKDTYSKTEIDNKLGDIDAILDVINGEVI